MVGGTGRSVRVRCRGRASRRCRTATNQDRADKDRCGTAEDPPKVGLHS